MKEAYLELNEILFMDIVRHLGKLSSYSVNCNRFNILATSSKVFMDSFKNLEIYPENVFVAEATKTCNIQLKISMNLWRKINIVYN